MPISWVLKLLLGSSFLGAIVQACSIPVFINELHYDNTGTDRGEFVEIAGPAGTDLNGWSLVFYNGNGGAPYSTRSLSGALPDSTANGFGFVTIYEVGIQNGSPDGLALVDNSGDVVQLLSYEGSFTAVGGAADGQTSIDIGVSQPSSTPVGASLQLSGTGTCYEDFAWSNQADDTPATVNIGQVFGEGEETPTPSEEPEACGDAFVPIFEIQGSGMSSPFDGTMVSIEGVVTGDFQGSDQLNGFFIQDPTGDGDSTTSDGIFVHAPDQIDVNSGDVVRVRGTVAEYFDLTELTDVELLLVCSSGSSVAPVEINLPVTSLDDFEAYEGMLVTFPQTLTVTETFSLGRYGEVLLSEGGRLFQPTNQISPDDSSSVAELATANSLRQILLDDFSTAQNPSTVPFLNSQNTLRGGSAVAGLTGVLGFGFGSYRIQPTSLPISFMEDNPRTTTPDYVGGDIRVASFNVLNYFNDIDNGSCPLASCRGADNTEEFVRQQAKIVHAILAIDADVVGLIEIENNGYGPGSAVQNLVAELNAAAGSVIYDFIDLGSPVGTDDIAVAFLYKPSTVTPMGSAAVLDSSVDPTFLDDKNRPSVAQTFDGISVGIRFTAVVNHFKSKGSACDDVGDPDTSDGQGNCNGVRTDAAVALASWLNTDPTGFGNGNVIVVGDLNSYAKEDPISALQDFGFVNLVETFLGSKAYSYVFRGQWGYIDHALASSSMLSQVTGTTVWHINSDEPTLLDYNTEFKPQSVQNLFDSGPFRSSDHDPIVVGIQCDNVPPVASISLSTDVLWPPNGQHRDVAVTLIASDDSGIAPTVQLVSVVSSEPDNSGGDGNTTDDVVIVDDFNFQLRAERSGNGNGRTYTITYSIVDGCGNSISAVAEVAVPKSQGNVRA